MIRIHRTDSVIPTSSSLDTRVDDSEHFDFHSTIFPALANKRKHKNQSDVEDEESDERDAQGAQEREMKRGLLAATLIDFIHAIV